MCLSNCPKSETKIEFQIQISENLNNIGYFLTNHSGIKLIINTKKIIKNPHMFEIN